MHNMFHLTRDHQKKEEPHLKHVLKPPDESMSWCILSVKLSSNVEKRMLTWLPAMRISKKAIPETAGSCSTRTPRPTCETRKMASCYNLLKRIIKLKLLIQSSRLSTLTLKRVASNGSMAPCRSHHGNHTRQEWIIIWSGRNWILKHAD